MRRKIPSSSSLQAFEAAARHGNFARAAEELSLTEGAISRQIGRLESFLNCKLFDRVGSRVKLNAMGTNYAHHVRETLERLDRDTQYIQGLPEGTQSLEISALPTFANRWLIPRLGKFKQKYPDITVNISVRTDPFILSGSGFDAAIHFEHPAWAGMRTQFLLEERLIPVCHPALLSDEELTGQLLQLPRIHRRQNPEAWEEYAEEHSILFKHPAQGVRYDLHEMAISAALAGLGVALVPSMYVENELENGLLAAPWPKSKLLKKRFCLVKPPETGINESILMIFEKWLETEIIK
ncbi:LysR substrate binding domain protein [Acinetobacter calcoaceticus RUH2202]|uniref:LysR substrate-binding domain-containing protein n=1 Tax=Acinetobacter calcoaceticus TaxID=471 RepID=UPI0001BB4ACE|nr:LysR substrate-binding domain-containing protein [Acinetobacter calcoaceticus]EEY77181.1 LysR substrate binding domain protein [Acinetobacter calcoaceticus RUH2202]